MGKAGMGEEGMFRPVQILRCSAVSVVSTVDGSTEFVLSDALSGRTDVDTSQRLQ